MKLMIIDPIGNVIDVESETEPRLNDSFVYKNRTYRISECHQSVVPEMWDWIVTLAR